MQKNRYRGRRHQASKAVQAHVQMLEERVLLTAATLVDGVLTIEGTEENDRIDLSYSVIQEIYEYDQVELTVQNSLDGFSAVFMAYQVDRIEISTFDGNDTVKHGVNQLRIDTLIHAGAGDDLVDASFNSSEHTILGESGNDVLAGGQLLNHIHGGDGDDLLAGGDGVDMLIGGSGNDKLYGGRQSDTLLGNAGDDFLHSGGEGNVLNGGEGRDTMIGSGMLDGGADDDVILNSLGLLMGGGGDDYIDGAGELVGGPGNDVLVGTVGTSVFHGGDGDDHLRGWGTLEGGAGDDVLQLGDWADLGHHYSLVDRYDPDGTLIESASWDGINEALQIDLNESEIDGGTGNDTVDYSALEVSVTVNLNKGLTTGQRLDTLRSIENVIGTAFSDVLIGDKGTNILQGLGGNDQLIGGLGDDSLRGGAGVDTADFSGTENGVTADLASGFATGQGLDSLESIENVVGTKFDDVLIGDNSDNTLDGRGGNDLLDGRAGNDVIVGGKGVDTVDYRQAKRGVDVNLTSGMAWGDGMDDLMGVENVIGSRFDDILVGDAGENRLEGFDGNDLLEGLAGADWLEGGDGKDLIDGGQDDDLLIGGFGNDHLYGGAGDDVLYDAQGNNWMFGGLGNDVLKHRDDEKMVFEENSEKHDLLVGDFDELKESYRKEISSTIEHKSAK